MPSYEYEALSLIHISGGQAVNFAVYARMLGAESDFMGVFGKDAVADHVQASLDAHGVGHSHCRIYEGENGFARVTQMCIRDRLPWYPPG